MDTEPRDQENEARATTAQGGQPLAPGLTRRDFLKRGGAATASVALATCCVDPLSNASGDSGEADGGRDAGVDAGMDAGADAGGDAGGDAGAGCGFGPFGACAFGAGSYSGRSA